MLKIKQIREYKGITQDEISKGTGIPKRTYINYEQLKRDIPFTKLKKIADFLNVSISEIIGEDRTKEELKETTTIQSIEDLLVEKVTVKVLSKFSTYFEKTELLEFLVLKLILEPDDKILEPKKEKLFTEYNDKIKDIKQQFISFLDFINKS